jgi:hypothetical protein
MRVLRSQSDRLYENSSICHREERPPERHSRAGSDEVIF